MAKLIWKPNIVDFGYKPGEKTIRFIHEGTNIVITATPSWLTNVSISFTPYVSGIPKQGTITATVSYDAPFQYATGYISVSCDGEGYLIPVAYNYDSEHIPIKDVIESVMTQAGDESYIREKDRTKALLAAKRWIQDWGGVTGTNVRFAELTVDGGVVNIPGDFVDYVGVYAVSDDGYLKPLYWNDEINIGQENLQDQDYFYLLDGSGNVIGAHGLTPRVDNENPYTYYGVDLSTIGHLNNTQRTIQVKPGKVSLNGMYRYDKPNRQFVISAGGLTSVVVQYVSDPLLRHDIKMDVGEIRVPKQYREALEMFIYYTIIELNRHVQGYEKRRALQAYKLALKRARVKQINLPELIQVLKGNR